MIILRCFGGTTILGNTHIWRIYGAASPNPPVDGSWSPPPCGCGAVVWGSACQRAASRTMMPKRRKCACKSYNDPSCLFRDAHQKPWPWRRRLFSLSLRMNHCGITPSNLLGADFSSSCANLAPTVHPGVLAGWQNCTALLSKCFSTSVWWRAMWFVTFWKRRGPKMVRATLCVILSYGCWGLGNTMISCYHEDCRRENKGQKREKCDMGTLYIEAECKAEKEKRHGIHWKLHHRYASTTNSTKTKGPALPLYLLPIPWGGGGNTGHGTIYIYIYTYIYIYIYRPGNSLWPFWDGDLWP